MAKKAQIQLEPTKIEVFEVEIENISSLMKLMNS